MSTGLNASLQLFLRLDVRECGRLVFPFFSALEKKGKLFETDIELSPQDIQGGEVDTSQTGDAKGAEVEVESIGEKRKGIRTRRKIWPSRIIPVTATSDMGRHVKRDLYN